jgi:hypothetical protein
MRNTLLITVIAAATCFGFNGQTSKAGDSPNVAAITTYVPAIGDTLEFRTLEPTGRRTRQLGTIATIATNGVVTLQVKVYVKTRLDSELEATWTPKDGFLASIRGLDGVTIKPAKYVVGNKSVACYVAHLEDSELWIAATEKRTFFPGLLMVKKDNKIVFRLVAITRAIH